MRIILDENLPRPLKQVFPGHIVTTVQEEGLSGMLNGNPLFETRPALNPDAGHDANHTF
jgi:hypothetical protein